MQTTSDWILFFHVCSCLGRERKLDDFSPVERKLRVCGNFALCESFLSTLVRRKMYQEVNECKRSNYFKSMRDQRIL